MDDKTDTSNQTPPGAPARSNNPRSRVVNDEKSEARELWFKTVVKILKWKEGKGKSTMTEPVSEKEWSAYYKETLKINTSSSKDKTLKKLKETEELIKKHGGFAS